MSDTVPRSTGAHLHRSTGAVKLRPQGGLLPSGVLELLAHACSRLSCADPDGRPAQRRLPGASTHAGGAGATLNLYTPLFRWTAEDEEDYSSALRRRVRDILARTRDNPTTAYVGSLWAWAHARAYRLALEEQCGVDRIYADGCAPEQSRCIDLSCVDTAFVWEKVPTMRLLRASASGGLRCAQELVDMFNPSSAVTTAAGRLVGKGLRPLASVRYVKAQIVRHLQASESDNEFVAFVLRAAVLGMYPGAATRAGLDTYLNLITKGRSALLEAIEPLSSREIFSMVRPHAALCARHCSLQPDLRVPRVLWPKVPCARKAVRSAQRQRLSGAV